MIEDPSRRREVAPWLEAERAIVAGARDLRILGTLAWPREVLEGFLAGWRRGRPEIPRPVPSPPPGLGDVIVRMEAVMRGLPRGEPLGDLLWKTAWSTSTAARMLHAMGTPAFCERSIELYGRPDVKRPNQDWSDLDAAEFLLAKSADLLASCAVPDLDASLPAEELARRLGARIDPIFVESPIAVELTPDLASRAAASGNRVRLRADARFSELDLDQLFEHEVMVHAATKINGERQPFLDVLGLASPRTTRTQEGLATFAEIVTGSMDLVRLRRIALRVRAIAMALAGADFLEVFRMFLEEGQSEEESAQSAMRIFRGGDPRGGVAFTKDGTYVAGLIEVQTFLRLAVRDGRPELIPHLFAGRLTLGDAVLLDPLFRDGILEGPRIIPTWASDLRRLTASMTFAAFQDAVDLGRVSLESAVQLDDRSIEGSPAAMEAGDSDG